MFRDPYGLSCDMLSLFHQQYTGTNALYELMEPLIKNEIVWIGPEELWCVLQANGYLVPLAEREGMGGTADENT